MSLLQHYAQLEIQIQELQKNMEALQSKEQYKKEKQFLDKLRDLMQEFDKSGQEVIHLLTPEDEDHDTAGKRRKKRKLKIYRNPNTDETVETRGGNHKTLKVWKEEYGSETVESWMVEER